MQQHWHQTRGRLFIQSCNAVRSSPQEADARARNPPPGTASHSSVISQGRKEERGQGSSRQYPHSSTSCTRRKNQHTHTTKCPCMTSASPRSWQRRAHGALHLSPTLALPCWFFKRKRARARSENEFCCSIPLPLSQILNKQGHTHSVAVRESTPFFCLASASF